MSVGRISVQTGFVLVSASLLVGCGGRNLSAEDYDGPLSGEEGGSGTGGYRPTSGGTADTGGAQTRGSCCDPHEGPGCNDGQIVRCVCQSDEYCCEAAWDESCVTEVNTLGCGSCAGACDRTLEGQLPLTVTGTTTGETNDHVESCGGESAPDVAFEFTAPATANYVFDTAGSPYDTLLAVRADGCDGLELACNDDRIEDRTSSVTVRLTEGQRVGVVVDGWATEYGPFTLHVRSFRDGIGGTGGTGGGGSPAGGSSAGGSPAGGSPAGGSPAGGSPTGGVGGTVPLDSCCAISPGPGCLDPDVEQCVCSYDPFCCDQVWDDACVASVEELGCGVCNSTCDGVLDGSLPLVVTGTTAGATNTSASNCGGSNAPDVSYLFTAPRSATYTVSAVGSAYDTVLYVVDGGCDGPVLVCNDDQWGLTSELGIWLSQGQRVGIVMDGYGPEQGVYQLSVSESYGGQGGEGGGWGGMAGDAPTGGTGAAGSGGSSSCCWPGTATGCDDDRIAECVCGTLPDCCTSTWSADCATAVARLGCGDCGACAPALGRELPLSVTGSTVWSTDAHASSCGSQFAPDVTFSFTAPDNGTYVFDTLGSAYDTVLDLLDSDCGGTSIGCNDDWIGTTSRISVSLSAGQTIGVVVDGWSAHSGSFVLNVSRQ